jgi:hypothetical protein
MSAGDIIHVLQHLGFVNGLGLLLLDRGIRDYLVRALRQAVKERMAARRFPPPWTVEEQAACFRGARSQRAAAGVHLL